MKPPSLLACFLLLSTLALAQHPHKKTTKGGVPPRPKADTALTIHQSALIVDTHADTPQRFLDENFDLGQTTPVTDGHIDLEKIKQGNLGAEFFSIWVEPEFKGHYAKRAMDLIDSVYQQAARHPDKITMAFTAGGLGPVHTPDPVGTPVGLLGGPPTR